MKSSSFLPLAGALVPLWLVVIVVYLLPLPTTGGSLVYALDDAYIHMGIARNFVEHGVWGVTEYQFSSSTSSPLWTLLIAAGFAALGVQIWLPLVYNVILASMLLVAVWWFGRQQRLSPMLSFGLLVAVAFAAPLPTLIFGGLEHVLHAVLTITFAWVAAGRLSQNLAPSAGLLVLAAFATATRYESLFLIGLVAVAFAVRRRWGGAAAVLLAGLLPVTLYGLVSMANGWGFLPNPLLLKGGMPQLDSITGIVNLLGNQALSTLLRAPDLLITVAAGGLAFVWAVRRRGAWSRPSIVLGLFVLTAIAHAQFAQVGWLFRYEAYLIAFGVTSVGLALGPDLRDAVPRHIEAIRLRRMDRSTMTALYGGALLVLLLFATPLVSRGVYSLTLTPQAMTDRSYEHITIARFIGRYYDREPVMLNDIGTTAFFTDARILDIYGLGSREPIELRRRPEGYSAGDIRLWAEANSVRVAIVQSDWLEINRRIPIEWTWIGDWVLPRNVVFNTHRVGVFAIDPAHAPVLTAQMRDFSESLPRAIRQEGPFTQPPLNERGRTDQRAAAP